MLRDIEINERKVNWAISVRQLLCNLGFREVWIQQNVGNCNAFLTMFRQRVRDILYRIGPLSLITRLELYFTDHLRILNFKVI